MALHERTRQWRGVRERAARRIGLVLADDAPGLAPPIFALDRDTGAETDFGIIRRRRRDLCGGAALGPVAQLACGLRSLFLFSSRQRFGVSRAVTLDLGID